MSTAIPFSSPADIPDAILDEPDVLEALEQFEAAYWTFRPRPDQPDRYDQQTAFVESRTQGVKIVLGGNGCLGAEQLIPDPVADVERRVGEIDEPFHVWTRNPTTGKSEIGMASRPWVKGRDELYQFMMSDGNSFVATLEHRVLSASGEWTTLRRLLEDAGLSVGRGSFPPSAQQQCHIVSGDWKSNHEENQEDLRSVEWRFCLRDDIDGQDQLGTIQKFFCLLPFVSTGRRKFLKRGFSLASSWKRVLLGWKTVLDFLDGYLVCRRFDDGQLHRGVAVGREFFPSQGGVLERTRTLWRWGVRVFSHRHSFPNTLAIHRSRVYQRYLEDSFQNHTSNACHQLATEEVSSCDDNSERRERFATIVSATFIRVDDFYDLTVYPYNNYLASGVWHHNSGTTTSATAAMVRFLMTTPPPRKNTPFWVIGPNLEQTMETVWGEKLCALGHLPGCEVDWDRISWWQPRKNLPFAVPLRDWEGRPGKNWVIEFRAWRQGRTSFQARSIGGFFFLEQFPFEILQEVLRGCREYDYPGSKLVEFTPVDPNIGTELLELIEDDKLPDGWEVYYLNTKCAMEAGHVRKSWFDEFFATVPETMRETKMTGRLPKWEGLIYPQFNRAIHVVGDDMIDHPPNVHYRRGIDWGAGPENPFAAVWAYKNSLGQWFVFDEYKNAEERMVTEHLQVVSDRWLWPENNAHYGTTYADPSGKAFIRIADRLPEVCPGYDRMPMTAASNDVLPGIEYVQYLLQVDPKLATPEHPEGQPRLFIYESCKEMIKEFAKYKWDRGATETSPDAHVRPVKKSDHLMDALRYLLFSERSLSVGKARSSNDREETNVASRHGVRHQRRANAHLLGRR